MRIRNIKPGFFKNEHLGSLDFNERLLFIGLWLLADAEGRLEDRPARIRMELFGYDDKESVPVDQMLDSLTPEFVTRYEANGEKYLQINKFQKHQALSTYERKQKSDIPPPDSLLKPSSSTTEVQPKDTRRITVAQQPDEGRRTKDKGDTSPPAREGSSEEEFRLGLNPPWSEWVRKVKEAHPCCRDISDMMIIAAIRVYRGEIKDAGVNEAVAAFERHMSGAAGHANPLQKFENYLRKGVSGESGKKERPGTTEFEKPLIFRPTKAVAT